MNCLRYGIVLWLIFLGTGTAAASDWPTFKHDNSRVGYTADPLRAALTLRWIYSASEAPQKAWPGPGGEVIEGLHLRHRMRFDDVFHTAMAAGKAIFGSSVDNHVYAYDCDSGELLWSFSTNGPVRLAPTVANGKVYVGSDDGFAYCLNADDGSLIWKLRAAPRDERILARGRMSSRWPVRTSVLVDKGVAYFGAGTFPHENVYLLAADAETGDRLWLNDSVSQRDAGRSDFTPQGYLLASNDLLFVPSGRTLPAAFNRSTGQLVYKQRGGGKQVGGTQNLLTEDQLYTVGEHNILAMGQTGGSILGKLPARQITFDGDIAFLATGKEISAVAVPLFPGKTESAHFDVRPDFTAGDPDAAKRSNQPIRYHVVHFGGFRSAFKSILPPPKPRGSVLAVAATLLASVAVVVPRCGLAIACNSVRLPAGYRRKSHSKSTAAFRAVFER